MRSDPKPPRPQVLRTAYQQLVAGAETLLGVKLFWTERALLTLVSLLYRRRLQQIPGLPADNSLVDAQGEAREAMLAGMAEAALGGHDLSEWEKVDNGYQARCINCDMTSWVSYEGMRYSLLEDECPKTMG